MVNHIFLRQVVAEMERVNEKGEAVPFDMEVWTYNRHNKSGGDLKKYTGAKLLIPKKMKGKIFVVAEHQFREDKKRKNPNHWQNATRNIETQSDMVRKINIRLIKKFNDLEVIY